MDEKKLKIFFKIILMLLCFIIFNFTLKASPFEIEELKTVLKKIDKLKKETKFFSNNILKLKKIVSMSEISPLLTLKLKIKLAQLRSKLLSLKKLEQKKKELIELVVRKKYYKKIKDLKLKHIVENFITATKMDTLVKLKAESSDLKNSILELEEEKIIYEEILENFQKQGREEQSINQLKNKLKNIKAKLKLLTTKAKLIESRLLELKFRQIEKQRLKQKINNTTKLPIK